MFSWVQELVEEVEVMEGRCRLFYPTMGIAIHVPRCPVMLNECLMVQLVKLGIIHASSFETLIVFNPLCGTTLRTQFLTLSYLSP